MIIGTRYASLDNDLSLPLICTSYMSHPASINGTGSGTADTILGSLHKAGFTDAQLQSMMKGSAYDGAFLNTKVTVA